MPPPPVHSIAKSRTPEVSERIWRWPPALRASFIVHGLALGWVLFDPLAWRDALALFLANHLVLFILSVAPRAPGLGPNYTRLSARAVAARQIALTFDDGPDPVVTPLVLELLAERRVRATFFCVGRLARAHPDLIDSMIRAGHSVENHTDEHSLAFAFWGPLRMLADLRRAQESFVALGISRPRFLRSPAGMRNPWFDWAAQRAGLLCVSWTCRGFDTVIRSAAWVEKHLIARLRPGVIVLLHDGHSARTADGRPVVLAALPGLLDAIEANGLVPVTLRDALP